MSTHSPIYAVVLGTTACLFAGCSTPGPQSAGQIPVTDSASAARYPGSGTPAGVHSVTKSGFMSSAAKGSHRLLYISDPYDNKVNVYLQKGHNQSPIGHIAVNYPTGLAVAHDGDLFVASPLDGVVLAYHKGKTKPYATLTGTSNAGGVAVDGAGNVYVANGTGAINVYARGSTTPTSTLTDGNIYFVYNIAVDGAGDLFLSGQKPAPPSPPEIDEFPSGSMTPTTLPIAPAGVASVDTDAANDLVIAFAAASNLGTVAVYPPPYTTDPSTSFNFTFNGGYGLPIALDRSERDVWVGNSSQTSGHSQGQKYSLKTGMLRDSTSGDEISGPIAGIAVSPVRGP